MHLKNFVDCIDFGKMKTYIIVTKRLNCQNEARGEYRVETRKDSANLGKNLLSAAYYSIVYIVGLGMPLSISRITH